MKRLKLAFDEFIPLRDIVFKTIREAIITGDLKPGERLMEVKLASDLGVSRTPIREAIRKLELEGLVVMSARRGARVAPINEKDIREVLEIRKALESLAVGLACSDATEEDIEKLKGLNEAIKQTLEEEDVESITKADVDFHEAIYEITGNDRLVQILHQLKEHIFRFRFQYIKEMKNKDSIVSEHDRIIDAIEGHKIKAAKKEIEHHIEAQEKYILNILANEVPAKS